LYASPRVQTIWIKNLKIFLLVDIKATSLTVWTATSDLGPYHSGPEWLASLVLLGSRKLVAIANLL
jgi:hypothetical protein